MNTTVEMTLGGNELPWVRCGGFLDVGPAMPHRFRPTIYSATKVVTLI